jgi:hypothetical protein
MTHPDLQRRAYSDASESDWAREAELLAGATIHLPGDPDAPPIRTPEEWEGWDTDRQSPKTVAEAQAALAGRIADPDAPDTEAVAGAYDDLED